MRLQKYIAHSGLCSRREAEALIQAGRVHVNGEVATVGSNVSDKDRIEVDRKPLSPVQSRHTYILLNKPRGVISTMADERGRRCVKDLLSDLDARLVPVGRLDRLSEGLLLLTDDGALVYKLTHPKYGVEKQYIVTVRCFAGGDLIDRLRSIKEVQGAPIQKVGVEVLTKAPDRSVLRFTIREGRNRQIRRMCEQAGVEVMRLKRISIGSLKLRDLKPGQWRSLTAQEVSALRSGAQEVE